MRMPVNELILLLQEIGREQLRGTKLLSFEVALLRVKAMRGLMESGLAELTGVMAYRDQRWSNVQSELLAFKRILEKRNVRLSDEVKADLDHYCTCTAPEDY